MRYLMGRFSGLGSLRDSVRFDGGTLRGLGLYGVVSRDLG